MSLRLAGFSLALVAVWYGCVGFQATHNAGVRRLAESRLAVCRKGTITGIEASHCYAEVHAFCLAQGLERTCGEGFQ